jgi:membrane-bound lytic murein transglycosylase D
MVKPNITFLTLIVTVTLMSGCVSLDKTSPASKNDAVSKVISKEEASKEIVTEKESTVVEKEKERSAEDIENLTIDEVIRMEEPNTQNLYDNSRYDFPITMNSKVEGWIDYFTGRGRTHMERYLARSSRYIPLMKQVFKKSGLPEDLVYLALIESGFNLRANSRARAVGPWQFIKGTGKRYGLRVDAWVDQRRDPIASTEAAAKYLKDLYLMFESWYLAASAYNAGEYKIMRAIEELKTNNYWRICTTRLLRRETKDYVPKLIAAAIIGKNPEKYGFEEVVYQEPLEFEVVTIDVPIQLKEVAKLVDVPEDEILDLNPELRRGMVPPGYGPYEVKVPVGSRVLVERAIAALHSKTPVNNGAGNAMPKQHTVARGETLASIARKYRVSRVELANVNNLVPKERLTPGFSLIIPGVGSAREGSTARIAKIKRVVSSKDDGNFIFYTVRSGESLWTISEKFNVTVQELFRWNSLKKSALRPGKKLRIKSENNALNNEATAAAKAKKNKQTS